MSSAKSQIEGIFSRDVIVCSCCESYFKVDKYGTQLLFRGKI